MLVGELDRRARSLRAVPRVDHLWQPPGFELPNAERIRLGHFPQPPPAVRILPLSLAPTPRQRSETTASKIDSRSSEAMRDPLHFESHRRVANYLPRALATAARRGSQPLTQVRDRDSFHRDADQAEARVYIHNVRTSIGQPRRARATSS